jgi:hypothetical protein
MALSSIDESNSGFVKHSVFMHLLDCTDILISDETVLKEFVCGECVAYKDAINQLCMDPVSGLWSIGFKLVGDESVKKKQNILKIKERINTINLKKLNESNDDSNSVCQRANSLFDKVIGEKTRATAKTRPKTNSIAGSMISRKTYITKGSISLAAKDEVFTEPSIIAKKQSAITPRETQKIDIFTKTPRPSNPDYQSETHNLAFGKIQDAYEELLKSPPPKVGFGGRNRHYS